MLDASIACGTANCSLIRAPDYCRALSMQGRLEAWGGPYRDHTHSRGGFRSYIPTPPFAEYTSGHSAFSAASAEVLKLFTGSPVFGASVTIKAGTSSIEPGSVPASDVTLRWETLDQAADQAGLSRRFGGIHFRQGDLESREMGKRIVRQVWRKALHYIHGTG